MRELLSHPAFALTNPNSCYSLFLGFARSAPNFHAKDGSGYEFLADAVIKVGRGASLRQPVLCSSVGAGVLGVGCHL